MLGEGVSAESAPAVPPDAAPRPDLSLVVCTLNEVEAIGPLIAEIAAAMAAAAPPLAYEIIVVDDGSTDGTPGAVMALQDPRVRLIERVGVRGLASAALAGWDEARAPFLALMDGDGQHDPALLPHLFAALRGSGADLAIGARDLSAHQALSPLRVRLSKAGVWLAGHALRLPLGDPMSGYFVMRRGFYDEVRPRVSGVGFKILVDLAASARARPRFVELTTALRPRHGGVSKLDLRVIADLVALLAEKRLGGLIPARFILFTGVGVSGVAMNLAVLGLLFRVAGLPFALSQSLAIFVAMGWNFWLNNQLTFRDRRLRGAALARGFLAFVAACAVGAVVNVALAEMLFRFGLPWPLAGGIGALAAGVFNFWAVRRLTWKVRS